MSCILLDEIAISFTLCRRWETLDYVESFNELDFRLFFKTIVCYGKVCPCILIFTFQQFFERLHNFFLTLLSCGFCYFFKQIIIVAWRTSISSLALETSYKYSHIFKPLFCTKSISALTRPNYSSATTKVNLQFFWSICT